MVHKQYRNLPTWVSVRRVQGCWAKPPTSLACAGSTRSLPCSAPPWTVALLLSSWNIHTAFTQDLTVAQPTLYTHTAVTQLTQHKSWPFTLFTHTKVDPSLFTDTKIDPSLSSHTQRLTIHSLHTHKGWLNPLFTHTKVDPAHSLHTQRLTQPTLYTHKGWPNTLFTKHTKVGPPHSSHTQRLTKSFAHTKVDPTLFTYTKVDPTHSLHKGWPTSLFIHTHIGWTNSLFIRAQWLNQLTLHTRTRVEPIHSSHTHAQGLNQLTLHTCTRVEPTHSWFWKAMTPISCSTKGSSGAMLWAKVKKRSASLALLVSPYSRPMYSTGRWQLDINTEAGDSWIKMYRQVTAGHRHTGRWQLDTDTQASDSWIKTHRQVTAE